MGDLSAAIAGAANATLFLRAITTGKGEPDEPIRRRTGEGWCPECGGPLDENGHTECLTNLWGQS